MIRTFFVSATVATLGFAAPAFADSAYIHIGPYGGYVQGSYHTAPAYVAPRYVAPRYVAPRYVAPAHVSRSYSVEGAYGGSVTRNRSCSWGDGCTRERTRTGPGGRSATRSVTRSRW